MTVGAPASAYVAGQVAILTLMKNADHYNKAAPGNFTVVLWDAGYKGSQFLASYPDTASGDLSQYNIPVTIPAGAASGAYVIQTMYYTDNTSAPPVFYQCSDGASMGGPRG